MSLHTLLIEPFAFDFMRRALVACTILAIAAGPIGTLLLLRRMSLVGDALSHAVLPGAALGFLAGGLSIPAMSLGGAIAGLAVALAAGIIARTTSQREDSSFAALYLISLALGVLIVSMRGSSVDLLQILFGSLLAVDAPALILVAAIVTVTLLAFAVSYRALVADCVDPEFLRAVGGRGGVWHALFLTLLVLNLVAGFQTLGTLMAVGLMILPAAAARFWGGSAGRLALIAVLIGMASALLGLLASYHLDLPSGPAVILVAGVFYLVSMILRGRR